MSRVTSTGTCALCGGTYGKSVMSRHLATCKLRPAESAAPARRSAARKSSAFHLVVTDCFSPAYWLHLETAPGATLGGAGS